MPKLNGMELINLIKEEHQDVACIILSGFMENDVVMENEKVFKFLTKPYKVNDVATSLDEAYRGLTPMMSF